MFFAFSFQFRSFWMAIQSALLFLFNERFNGLKCNIINNTRNEMTRSKRRRKRRDEEKEKVSWMPSKYISFYVWLRQGLTIQYYHLAVFVFFVLSNECWSERHVAQQHNIQSHRTFRYYPEHIKTDRRATGFHTDINIVGRRCWQSECYSVKNEIYVAVVDDNLNVKLHFHFTMCHKKAIKTQPHSVCNTYKFTCLNDYIWILMLWITSFRFLSLSTLPFSF